MLVGSVTTLVVVVSVFLAYHANTGLPFVPTYDVSAELPGGQNLVAGNEVRVGGFRVGIVEAIRTKFRRSPRDGELRAIAVVDLKLDKTVEPLGRDSRLAVRPRSSLGLKYVEVTPGDSGETFEPGATIPLRNAAAPIVEIDELLSTFDESTREHTRKLSTGFGDALAGRGGDINQAIASLGPFFTVLRPVMVNLADPRTGLRDFVREIGETSAELRPVAGLQGALFRLVADTIDAVARDAGTLRQTIERTPPTLAGGIRSLPAQRRLLAEATDLSHRLRPTARILPRALGRMNPALRTGTQVLPQTVALNREAGRTFDALRDLADEPSTLLALKDLSTATAVGAPLLEHVAPYQTVCSYANYFFAGLGGHMSDGTAQGTAERILVKSDNHRQDNRWSDFPADRPADVPADVDPSNAYVRGPEPEKERVRQASHTQPFAPAVDARGNADCQIGNTGYIDGPLGNGGHGRYEAADDAPNFDRDLAGGSHVVGGSDTPGLGGPTYNGVARLSDVP